MINMEHYIIISQFKKNAKKAQINYYTLWNCRCGEENES